MNNPLREALKVTATGAATVLTSTVVSCGLAIAIETTAHRIQYRLFPHWYDEVEHAMGLPSLQQRRALTAQTYLTNEETGIKEEVKVGIQSGETFISSSEEDTFLSELKKLASDNSQTHFQAYQEKIQEKRMMLDPERASKILLTTAMCG